MPLSALCHNGQDARPPEPLLRQVRPSRATNLANFFVAQAPWSSKETTYRNTRVVALSSNNVIDANGLIQADRFGLVDEYAMTELSGWIFGLITWILDHLRHWPHGDQIPGALVFPLKCPARRNNPQPISRHQIGKDTMVGVPAEVFAVGGPMPVRLVVDDDIHGYWPHYVRLLTGSRVWPLRTILP